MSKSNLNPRLQAAIGYANLGWPVFPLYWINSKGACACGAKNCVSPGKHPLIKGGHNNATKDVAVLEKQWEQWPEANIGIRTGAAAGVFVLDIDPVHGGEASLKEIEALNSPLPRTLEANSGGGGKHFYFQYPKDETVIKNRIGFKAGLDIRAEGGYVLAAPSNHFSGNSYSWNAEILPGMIEIAEAPKWLFELIIHKDDKTLRGSSKRQIAINQIPKGKRNSALASLGGKLRRGGCEYDAILAALQLENERRCEPPLTEFEVEKIAKSISRYLPEDKIGSGSSSAIPPADLAEEFLEDQSFRVSDRLTLREYKDEFYPWSGTHYELFSEGDMSSQIIRWLQQNPFVRSKAGNRLKSEIVANLQAMVNVRSDVNPPVNLAKIDLPVEDHNLS